MKFRAVGKTDIGLRRETNEDCVLVDDEAVRALTERRFWADDRLHLNESGHRRVAANVLHSLGVDDPQILGGPAGWWEQPLPPAPPSSDAATITGTKPSEQQGFCASSVQDSL